MALYLIHFMTYFILSFYHKNQGNTNINVNNHFKRDLEIKYA